MKHIDKVFRDKFYNQKATVPDDMWDKIAPALEEKSGRSFLWFWFVGIMALTVGGIAYLLFTNYQAANPSNAPLAAETPNQDNQTSNSIPHALALLDVSINSSATYQTISTKTENDELIVESPKLKKNISSQRKVISNTPQKKSFATSTDKPFNINSTLIVKEGLNTDNLYGKPANLVITKSYISDNGSIIEKSDLSNGAGNSEPSYNVFINSEGLNAGALLRIIEPLENIPLPAFSIILKKKIML